MLISDIFSVLQWWITLFIIGVVFFPLTSLLFNEFFDKGYIFSKIVGTVIITYCIFVFGILHVLSFTFVNSLIIFVLAGAISFIPYFRATRKKISITDKLRSVTFEMILLEELLFLLCLFFWSYVRAHQPDIHGLEKFMDFGFINSILRTQYFPAKDMWFPPFSINYYYFGHVYTAVLTRISGLDSSVTFNLMVATIFALTFTFAFSIGSNLYARVKPAKETLKTSLFCGFLAAFLISFGGNLHMLYSLFKPYNVDHPVPMWNLPFTPGTFPNTYWYPNATRFIEFTIHEFPIYSFVVSDLHGHVLSIPIVLAIIALLLNEFFRKPGSINFVSLVTTIFFISSSYMTNAWDGIIYFLLLFSTYLFKEVRMLYKYSEKNVRDIIPASIYSALLIGVVGAISFIIFTLPFSLFFKPFISGFGVLCAPDFLIQKGHIGPFLFEANHCGRSAWWELLTLYGFFYFWVILFGIFWTTHKKRLLSDYYVFLLIALSTLLIIIPEFVYAKDIYPAHYRANTMFKLVYQSFMMLSLVTAYTVVRLWKIYVESLVTFAKNMLRFPRRSVLILIVILLAGIQFLFIGIYPFFAIGSYYGDLKTYFGLDGTAYLKTLYPSDYQAIQFLNSNIHGQPVLLEAQGDSYTDYARISANTGIPTVLGWTVHEWLWRGTYDIPAPRITDVELLYESHDIQQTQNLIKKYNISYVFIGDLEHQKYPSLYEANVAPPISASAERIEIALNAILPFIMNSPPFFYQKTSSRWCINSREYSFVRM